MDVTLKVSLDEVKVIGAALSELPFKISAGLILKLQTQVNIQQEMPKQDEPNK